jgi:hypothetical protein
MVKLQIIIAWDGLMSASQFITACSDTIRHGMVSDDPECWEGFICSPHEGINHITEDPKWATVEYGNSSESFGWFTALEKTKADWVLLTYPGSAVHADTLIKSVESVSGPNDAVCFCAAMNYDIDNEVCDMIMQSNPDIRNVKELVAHEWGSILLSREAVRRFIQNKSVFDFMPSRSGGPIRFDHMSTLPRIAGKIPLTILKSMNSVRSVESFKGTNRLGMHSLIHYVGDWMDENGWHDYLRARLFASSLDGLDDGDFSSDLSMPEIKSDVILLLSQPGNIDRIKWLQKSCQQHIRPVPSIVVMLQENVNGKYYGRDYEKIVDFCASTRTGIIRMRQNRPWDEQELLLRGCLHLLGKKAKRIFASIGDCYMFNDPFKMFADRKGMIYFNEDGVVSKNAFGAVTAKEDMQAICDQFTIWKDHTLSVQQAKVESTLVENTKMIRRDNLFWKGVSRDSVLKSARDGHTLAATGESACRALIANA